MIKVIKFYGPTCPSCDIVEKNIKPIRDEFSGRVDFQDIEANAENSELFNKHNIRGIPAVILEEDGLELDRWIGAFPMQLLKSRLKEVLND